MNTENYKFSDITGKVIGCAMRVHSVLGNGFQEVIYQRALAIEFDKAGLTYQRECEIPIYYDKIEIGHRRADFLVENSVLLELKAITELDKTNAAQMINYLTAYKLEVGLLITFGLPSLQYKRFVKSAKSAIQTTKIKNLAS